MPLRPTIEQLLELSDDELKGPRAAELEDAIQRGLTAVHVGELWISQVARALADASYDAEHRAALEAELTASRKSVEDVRRQVGALHERAQRLGVGTPALP